MPCKIAASGETLVASRAVKSLRWWISACPPRGSDTVGHLRRAWVPSRKIGILHQRHTRSRVRLRSVSHALVHVRHLAERRTVGRIGQDLVVSRFRDTRFRLHSRRGWRAEMRMYELLMELGFCGNYSSRTFSVQDSRDVHDPTQRWSRT